MSAARKELQEALCRYTSDTLAYLDTVSRFCEHFSKWSLRRETELSMMMDIKDLSIGRVTQSQEKGKAMGEYQESKVTQVTADSRRAELEKELAAVLKDTLGGLEELHLFLDAVEKVAVTSLHVFQEENKVLTLPEVISLERVQIVVIVARLICPFLLEFKRDDNVFFLPRLQNVEVLSYQLDKYIQTTEKICDQLKKSCDFCLKTNKETVVDVDLDLSEDDVQRMLYHINQLDDIRMNQDFRMVFLFQEEPCSGFIEEFSERQPRMLKFLNDLEESAVQLDKMNKGARISSVVGSSVGAIGGVLSIIGLALIPVTAGVSLGLTMTGVGMGITSGVNSAVTTATEIGVNCTQQKKVKEVFQSFMEDVQVLQDCLEEATKREPSQMETTVGIGKVLCKAAAIGRGIDVFVDAASAARFMNAGKVVAQEGKALCNIPRVASDIPDIGQAAVKGPLALSKSARAGLIAVNALFIGMDIFFICKDSISLAKGCETEASQFIRARAALWRSETDSWGKICDSLRKGLLTFEKNNIIMETPFYPDPEKKETMETETETVSDEVDEKLKEKQSRAIQRSPEAD